MAVAMPRTLTEAWGERVTQDLAFWVDQVIVERAVARDELRQVLSRLDILEHDVAGVKEDVRQLRNEMNERLDRMNERFDRMNERFDRMESRMGERFQTMEGRMGERFQTMEGRMGERFDTLYERMMVQTRWTIGTIALFGTAVTILLAVAQFRP